MATEAQIFANPVCRGIASGEAGPLYICRESSTNQLLFMQNKPNFQKSQMNITPYNTKDYENKWQWRVRKNKPNSNPIKPNLKRAKMNISSIITKNYRKKDDFVVRINKPNSKPISEKPKMNVNLYVIEDYENETAFRPQKTNPNKANSVHEKQFRKSEPANVQTCLQTGKGGSFLLTFFAQSGKLLVVQGRVVS